MARGGRDRAYRVVHHAPPLAVCDGCREPRHPEDIAAVKLVPDGGGWRVVRTCAACAGGRRWSEDDD